MKCSNCGIENRIDATFCAHCGAPVKSQSATLNAEGKKCPTCGFTNPHHGKFCGRCGVDLRSVQHADQHGKSIRKQKKNKKKGFDPVGKWHPAAVALGLIAVSFVIVVSLQLFRDSKLPPPAVPVIETRSSDPKVEGRVMAIAERFICSCGSCGEKPLDVCTCATAIEERQLIRKAIQAGQEDGQIIAAVDSSYGWMKPDSTSKSGKAIVLPAQKVPALQPSALTMPLPVGTSVAEVNDRIAVATDREEIFSHFQCHCGQCAVDDLKACTCSHPRGATEVKGFVDRRIAERNATIAQLIKEVELKYGGRKD